jgi:RNA polymerase sigma-70 factor (ECF subfamily)
LIPELKNIIIDNKKKATALLFESYSKSLHDYAKYQWKIEEDIAWDIIYKSIDKLVLVFSDKDFANEAQLKSYLFRIFINYIKNSKRDEERKVKGARIIELNDSHFNKEEEEPNSNPKVLLLNQILDELDEWKRMLLLLKSQGFTYSEIAKYIKKPEKNLKVYYGRLKSQVKLKLEDQLQKSRNHEE